MRAGSWRPVRLCLAGLIGTGVAVTALAFTQEEPPAADARVDGIFAAMTAPGSPGCALAVMRDGNEVYRRGCGTANLEYGVPITPVSVFHVASISKQFTAAAVALLVADDKVSWTDDVRRYVPEVPDFGKTITLDHLAHHTSGLRDQWDLLSMAGWRGEADVVTTADVLDVTSRQTALNFDPGAEYRALQLPVEQSVGARRARGRRVPGRTAARPAGGSPRRGARGPHDRRAAVAARSLTFHRADDGRVAGFTMSTGRVRKVWFRGLPTERRHGGPTTQALRSADGGPSASPCSCWPCSSADWTTSC